MREVVILGAGLHRFGRFPEKSVEEMGREAIWKALQDANVPFRDIEAAYCGRVLPGAGNGGMGVGLRVITELGQTGIPVINFEQACASSSTAFREAYLAVANGVYDVALVAGFEKMQRGLIQVTETSSYDQVMGLAVTPSWYAMRARRYIHDYGATPEMFAQVSVVSHRNGELNPNAQYQKACTLEEVMNSRLIADPITLLQCSPTTDGAGAVVVCAKEKAAQYKSRWVTVVAHACGTGAYVKQMGEDGALVSEDPEVMEGPLEKLAKKAYERASIGPEDVEVAQVHDAFTPGLISAIEALSLFNKGEGARAVWEGKTEINGKMPVNTDGGLLSRGHPIGATGTGMIHEIYRQLMGEAGPRQVKGRKGNGPKVGMVQNSGIGGMNILIFKN
ncbi:MAG: thiolase family protein [Chloroflexi bacterium]|nr:thiolase family protein [Chloroflexota bacterium]